MAFFEPWLVNTMAETAGPPVQNPNELDEAAFRELPPSPPVGIRLLHPGATRLHQLLHLVCGFRWDNVEQAQFASSPTVARCQLVVSSGILPGPDNSQLKFVKCPCTTRLVNRFAKITPDRK